MIYPVILVEFKHSVIQNTGILSHTESKHCLFRDGVIRHTCQIYYLIFVYDSVPPIICRVVAVD